jgi:membrane-associated phospholipid phosphatase
MRIAARSSAAICFCLAGFVSTNAQSSHPPLVLQGDVSKPQTTSFAGRIWKADVTKTLLAGLALTRISTHFDADAQYEASTESWAESDAVDAGDSYGNGGYLAAFSAATWGFGALSHNQEVKHTGTVMMQGLLLDAIIVASLKSTVGRSRPDGSDTRSFPSGHTSGAFTISTILARRHGLKVAIPAFGMATFTAIARMEDKRHYLSDVVAGAAIGIAIGQLMTPQQRQDDGGLQVVAGPSKVGLRLKF